MELARRRLRHELRIVKRGDIHKSGIFINVDGKDDFHVRALIIGPEGTPYKYGNYFFDLKFSPTEYPYVPPVVTLCTLEQGVRFNPNMYEKGKVCISILNTWAGEQWTSCQSLQSVLLTLQTIMTNEPLQNEPGFDTKTVGTCPRHRRYHELIEHENVRVAMLKMFDDCPSGFEVFLPVVRSEFLKNYKSIMDFVVQKRGSSPHQAVDVSCLVYSMHVFVDYATLLQQLHQYYAMFVSETDAEKSNTSSNSSGLLTSTDDSGLLQSEQVTTPPTVEPTLETKPSTLETSTNSPSTMEATLETSTKPPSTMEATLETSTKPPSTMEATLETSTNSPSTMEATLETSTNSPSTMEHAAETVAPYPAVEVNGAVSGPSPIKKKFSRPPSKARGYEDGHIECTACATWQVYTDKKGCKRWRRISDEAHQ